MGFIIGRLSSRGPPVYLMPFAADPQYFFVCQLLTWYNFPKQALALSYYVTILFAVSLSQIRLPHMNQTCDIWLPDHKPSSVSILSFAKSANNSLVH
jgi:hypothetical protein